MSVRVGKIVYNDKGRVVRTAHSDSHIPIVVTTKYSEYAALSPFFLKNDNNQIIENVYQFAKIYANVEATTKRLSRVNQQVIWNHPSEQHLDTTSGLSNELYWEWRKKGMNTEYAIRYPVGFAQRHNCLGMIWEKEIHNIDATKKIAESKFLSYEQGRKEVYYPLYQNAATKEPEFQKLQEMLVQGENLLIVEPDGPHQESLDYYKEKYAVNDDFIVNDSMPATRTNLQIMMNDEKHPFGHGYCLAALLQNFENLA